MVGNFRHRLVRSICYKMVRPRYKIKDDKRTRSSQGVCVSHREMNYILVYYQHLPTIDLFEHGPKLWYQPHLLVPGQSGIERDVVTTQTLRSFSRHWSQEMKMLIHLWYLKSVMCWRNLLILLLNSRLWKWVGTSEVFGFQYLLYWTNRRGPSDHQPLQEGRFFLAPWKSPPCSDGLTTKTATKMRFVKHGNIL